MLTIFPIVILSYKAGDVKHWQSIGKALAEHWQSIGRVQVKEQSVGEVRKNKGL